MATTMRMQTADDFEPVTVDLSGAEDERRLQEMAAEDTTRRAIVGDAAALERCAREALAVVDGRPVVGSTATWAAALVTLRLFEYGCAHGQSVGRGARRVARAVEAVLRARGDADYRAACARLDAAREAERPESAA